MVLALEFPGGGVESVMKSCTFCTRQRHVIEPIDISPWLETDVQQI